MTIKEELALIRLVKNGDKDALSRLWDDINPKLYGYLVNVLKDKSQADDILQETWLKAIEKIDKFKDRGVRFSAWLFAIARNECRQFWRQNKVGQAVSWDEMEIDISSQTSEQMDNNLMVEDILKRLRINEQEILRLRFIADLSFKEIARIMDISIISARVRVYRAITGARKVYKINLCKKEKCAIY